MSDIKTLEAELKTMREAHRAAQEALRSQIKTLKASAEKDGPGKLQRFQAGMDDILLGMCKPFEKMAADIKYKKTDPEGYEADEMIKKSQSMLSFFSKRIEKGKQLDQKSVDLLIRLETVLGVIQEKKLGRKWSEATDLRAKIVNLLPAGVQDQMKSMDDMLSQLAVMMNTACNPEKN